MSLRALINKLQRALAQKGQYIKMVQIKFYSEQNGRMLTKYILSDSVEVKGVKKNRTLLESFKPIEVVNYLAERLKEGE